MLKWAGLGVANGKWCCYCEKTADAVNNTYNDESGVAEAVEKYHFKCVIEGKWIR